VAFEILQGGAKPYFDESGSTSWQDFEVDWNLYWDRLTSGKPYSDLQKLQVFESCLSPRLREEIRLYRLNGAKLSYTAMLAQFQSRYASSKGLTARKIWQEVTMVNEGKTTRADLHEFWIKFCSAWHHVKDATAGEARRLFLERVPPFLSKMCIEEEDNRARRQPTVKLTGIPNPTEEGIKKSVSQITGGIDPRKVVIKNPGGICLVNFNSLEEALKLTAVNGRKLQGMENSLGAELVEQLMSVEDMFSHVEGKLALREKQDLAMNMHHFPKSFNKTNLTVREIGSGKVHVVEHGPDPVSPVSASSTGPVSGKSPSPQTLFSVCEGGGKGTAPPAQRGRTPPARTRSAETTWTRTRTPTPPARQGKGGTWTPQAMGRGRSLYPCFNCGVHGHYFYECDQPLSEALAKSKDFWQNNGKGKGQSKGKGQPTAQQNSSGRGGTWPEGDGSSSSPPLAQ
jgi:hypothetical protein